METNLFNRFQATLLAVATVGLVLLAVLNLRQERQFQQPDDGVWWVEASSGAGLQEQRFSPTAQASVQAFVQAICSLRSTTPRSSTCGLRARTLSQRHLHQSGVRDHARRHSARFAGQSSSPSRPIAACSRPCVSSASSTLPSASMFSSAAGPRRAPLTSTSSAWSRSPSMR